MKLREYKEDSVGQLKAVSSFEVGRTVLRPLWMSFAAGGSGRRPLPTLHGSASTTMSLLVFF